MSIMIHGPTFHRLLKGMGDEIAEDLSSSWPQKPELKIKVLSSAPSRLPQ